MAHTHNMVNSGPEMKNPGVTHYIITQPRKCTGCDYTDLLSRNGDPLPKTDGSGQKGKKK